MAIVGFPLPLAVPSIHEPLVGQERVPALGLSFPILLLSYSLQTALFTLFLPLHDLTSIIYLAVGTDPETLTA